MRQRTKSHKNSWRKSNTIIEYAKWRKYSYRPGAGRRQCPPAISKKRKRRAKLEKGKSDRKASVRNIRIEKLLGNDYVLIKVDLINNAYNFRSNSEERPVSIKGLDDKCNGMRRVSSSGDFPKSTSDDTIKLPARKHDQPENTLTYDDHEHDKRRSHERFARPHSFKSTRKCPNKRFKTRYQSKIKFKNEAQECSKRTVAASASGK